LAVLLVKELLLEEERRKPLPLLLAVLLDSELLPDPMRRKPSVLSLVAVFPVTVLLVEL
jgi:hypothetical protein